MRALSGSKDATIYQVAERAGLSIATVSRALRGSELVTARTRARVEQAARELRFTPNGSGRSLAEGRHAANGIVFPELVGPYYAEVILGYEETAAGYGSSVLILATQGRADAAAKVEELAGRVDGMAVMGRTVDDEVIGRIAARGLPLVLLARDPVDGVDTISTRNERTAEVLARHLLAHGHRNFAFLGDPAGSSDAAGRYAGLAAVLAARGMAPPVPVPCGLDVESGRKAARKLLKHPPDVIVGANDEVALGVHLAAAQAGVAIPGDVAVTGWDDLMAARFAGLTTVVQPMRQLGATAARWLHERMSERQRDNPPTAARRRILPTRLVVRRSCGEHTTEETR